MLTNPESRKWIKENNKDINKGKLILNKDTCCICFSKKSIRNFSSLKGEWKRRHYIHKKICNYHYNHDLSLFPRKRIRKRKRKNTNFDIGDYDIHEKNKRKRRKKFKPKPKTQNHHKNYHKNQKCKEDVFQEFDFIGFDLLLRGAEIIEEKEKSGTLVIY